MRAQQTDAPGNPYMWPAFIRTTTFGEHAEVLATLAVAYEQRTANLLALLSVPTLDRATHEQLLAVVTARLGLEPAQ